jgi:FtsP/CotA-like multicopper oxidase with cupredoxin domain
MAHTAHSHSHNMHVQQYSQLAARNKPQQKDVVLPKVKEQEVQGLFRADEVRKFCSIHCALELTKRLVLKSKLQ